MIDIFPCSARRTEILSNNVIIYLPQKIRKIS
nr:MAG TPA_asm: hypothetical protein [Caudoviricetes sp.]